MHLSGKASKAFYAILKVFGLACYSVVDDKKIFVQTTFFDKIIFVATVGLWTALTYLEIREKIILDAMPEAKESFIQSLWLYLYISQNVLFLIVVVTSFMRRPRIAKIFKNLCDFDQKASRVSWKICSQEKLFKTALFLFITYVLLTIVYAILSIVSRWPENQFIDLNDLFNIVNDCVVLLAYAVLSEQFIVAVLGIRNRLSIMNTNFRYF